MSILPFNTSLLIRSGVHERTDHLHGIILQIRQMEIENLVQEDVLHVETANFLML